MNRAEYDTEPAAVAEEETSCFYIRFLYQHDKVWHGEIQWLNGKKTRMFRSLLELLVLMSEAMDSNQRQSN